MESKGKINEYICPDGHKIVTINTDEGVTPFILQCRHVGCNKSAKSQMHLVDQEQEPTHEWVRPIDLEELSEWDREHVEMGGLLLKNKEGHPEMKDEKAIAEEAKKAWEQEQDAPMSDKDKSDLLDFLIDQGVTVEQFIDKVIGKNGIIGVGLITLGDTLKDYCYNKIKKN